MLAAHGRGSPAQAPGSRGPRRAAGLAAVWWSAARQGLDDASAAGGAPPLLARVRLMFFAFSVFNLLLAVPSVLPSGPGRTAAGFAALATLAGIWSWTLRRGRFGATLRVLEPALIFAVASTTVVVEAVLGIFYVGLYYGALYGSRTVTITRGLAFVLALAAAYAHRDGMPAVADPSMFAHLWGATLSSLVMSLLRTAIEDQAASEQAKDEFLAVVSHELRTPLTSILGYLYTLEQHGDRLDVDRARHLLVRARVNAERQRELVDELLDVSRVLAGTMTPEIVEVRAHRIVAEVVVANDLDGATHQEVSEDDVVRVDRGQLAQMLSNLLTNAAKYGAPPIEITSHANVLDGTVTLRVRDHGPGVHERFHEQLFERFTQYSTGDRRTAKGVGLGLWIARELARTNGGDLRYEHDQRTPGACFALTLPGSSDASHRAHESRA